MSRYLPRRIPLALAISLALGSSSLWAQSVASPLQTASPRQFSIPAQPLGDALNAWARQTGAQLAVPQALVAGQSSPAVSGSLTPRQALDRLLAGTGLEASISGTEVVVRRTAAPELSGETTTLAPVTVTAGADRGGTTEGTGSYKATHTNTATKLNLTPRETPQTVTVVTRQQMDDFGMTSVDDALKATSGIVVQDQGLVGNVYYSRGFELQSQYDGIPNPAGISQNNRGPRIDNAYLDRVELLQGASGLLTGAGNPGGTINLVRKQPTESFQAQAEVQLGSWNQRRIVGDVSGPLVDSGRIRGRLVAVAENSDSFVDYVYRDRRGIYGVVDIDLTATTKLSASIQYQEDKGRNLFGVPLAADGSESGLSRSSYFGNSKNRTIEDSKLYTVSLSHRLVDDWAFRATYMRGKTGVHTNNRDYLSGALNIKSGDGLNLNQVRELKNEVISNVVDAYFSGPIHAWGKKHEIAFGLTSITKNDESKSFDWSYPVAINLFTFNPSNVANAQVWFPEISGKTKTIQVGGYGVGRFSLTDSLKLITGIRISNFEDKNLIKATTNSKETSILSPYAGLIYDVGKQYSAYVSYSDIFNPQTNKSADGGTLKPVVGANYEAGIKGELFDKKLNVAAAIFRLEQKNLAKLDESVPYNAANACAGYCYTAADQVVSQGIDLSANGEILPGWNVAAGYTYANSKYASGANEGQRYMTDLPRHSVRLFTNYKLPNSAWTIGGNLAGYSKIHTTGNNFYSGNPYTIRRGGLALVGLTAKYQINPKADLNFAINNLFDRTYRDSIQRQDYSTFGEPRKFAINLKYRF